MKQAYSWYSAPIIQQTQCPS